jgi:hypothetical protein
MTDETSPREYLSALIALAPRALRALWIGGIMLVVGLGATVAWTLSTDHLYRSEAVIAYDHGVRTSTVGTGDGDSPREIGGRLRDMLTSRQRFERIIKELNLYRGIAEHHGMGEAIDEMKKHVLVSSREDLAYRVSFDASGRELAQRGLELLLNGVVEEDSQRRIHEADETKHFLEAERKQADSDLRTKESALSGFLAVHPIFAHEAGGLAATTGGAIRARTDPERSAASSASSSEVAQLELQAAQIEEALAAAGVRVTTPGTAPAGDPPLVAARDRARTELQLAQRNLTEKQAMYTNEHPDVKAAIRHVAVAEAALHRADAALESDRAGQQAATPPPTPSAEDDSQDTARTAALKHALAAIRSQIASVKSRAMVVKDPLPAEGGSPVTTDVEWTRLNRDVAEARERQVQLQGKQFQAELMATLAGGGQGGRLVVIDPPFRPVRPITGRRFKIAGAGLAASMVLSLLTIVLFAAFDDRLYGDRDIHRIVKDGIVVVIPKLTGKSG